MVASAGGKPMPLGKVARVQGLRGEIRINPYSGDPVAFAELTALLLEETGAPVAVKSARAHKGQAIVKLAGIDSIEAAEPLVGREVFATREMLPRTRDDEYYWADLVGCRVYTAAGEEVGTVVRLENIGPHDNLIVERPGRAEAQIPFVEAMLKSVDVKGRRIEVDPPEGLLDLEGE